MRGYDFDAESKTCPNLKEGFECHRMESIYLRITEELNDLPTDAAKNIERVVFNILPIAIGVIAFTIMLSIITITGVFNDLSHPALFAGLCTIPGCMHLSEWLKADFYNHSEK